ncbi:MAG: DUF393 domain-containing protein [Planctomycetes bacterium]|nr:DUF393 domain-containing protein [Planctomycetota bacterium]
MIGAALRGRDQARAASRAAPRERDRRWAILAAMYVFDPATDRHDPRAPGGAWSGGQWSAVRFLLGGWVAWRLAATLPDYAANFGDGRRFSGPMLDAAAQSGGPLLGLLPNVVDWFDAPEFGAAFAALGVAAAVALAVGWRARIAALVVAYVAACIARHNPILRLPSPAWLALLLLAFACVPKAPFLSVDARKRIDPDGGWVLPRQTFRLMWLLLIAGSVLALMDQWRDPAWRAGSGRLVPITWLLMAAEAALCLSVLAKGRARAWAWLALLVARSTVLLLGGGDRRDEALWLVQWFAFDPGWLQGAPPLPRSHLFFDGGCGMCHRFVRVVLAEDRLTHFWVSPLQGRAITTLLDESTRQGLPDSIVVRTGSGHLLTKSSAIAAVLRPLGGLWRVAATLIELVPRRVRDGVYDAIAAMRKKLFRPPAGSCPLLPPAMRARFLE